MTDEIILVDKEDNEVGTIDKIEAHEGEGRLHRAFSIFIFNDEGKLLIQKRSTKKPLWPGFWSNSCCSHPRSGETISEAGNRRLYEELGFRTELLELYTFIYQARYGDIGSEHELCHVLLGLYDGPVTPCPNEIDEFRWISREELKKELSEKTMTPWFIQELDSLWDRPEWTP